MKYFFGKSSKTICKNVLCCKKSMFEGFLYSCLTNDLSFYGKNEEQHWLIMRWYVLYYDLNVWQLTLREPHDWKPMANLAYT